jgi:hypothetical protein
MLSRRQWIIAGAAAAVLLCIAGATVVVTVLLMSGHSQSEVITLAPAATLKPNPTIGPSAPPPAPPPPPPPPPPAAPQQWNTTEENRRALVTGIPANNPANDGLPAVVQPAEVRSAAFTAVRWAGDSEQVMVKGVWYELLAFDGLPVAEINQFARDNYPSGDPDRPLWQKRAAEDLVEVLIKMNHPPNNIVSLDLRRLDTGETINMPKVAMTGSNRESLITAALGGAASGGAAPGGAASGGAAAGPTARRGTIGAIGTGAPFTAVRWMDSTPWVKVNGTWYEFLGVDDIPLETILASAKVKYPDSTLPGWWKRQFLQVFGRLLRDIGHAPGSTVKLALRNLQTKESVTLTDVPMTNENQARSMLFMRASPFTAVRWMGSSPQVRVNDAWYEFVAMDGHPPSEVGEAPGDNGFATREAWMYAGWTPGDTVKLDLRALPAHEPVTLTDVPVTPLNAERFGLYSTRSPFTGVRWHDTTAEVQVNGTWYELVSVNHHAPSEFGLPEDRRLLDGLAGALGGAGDTVDLELRTLDTGQPVTMADVPMTTENHNAVVGWVQFAGNPDPSGLRAGPILGKVRWDNLTPQVQLSGTWYELLAIDGHPVADIIAFAQRQYGNDWQRDQFEDRTEKVMNQFGHTLFMAPHYVVILQLKTLDAGEVVRIIKSRPNFAPIPPG